MGKVPDGQLARMARCSLTAIINRRAKLGIAPYNRLTQTAPKAPEAVTSAPVQAPKARTAAQDAVVQATPTQTGMIIPFEVYARLAQEAWQ
jgi:hypothetical protein